MRAFVLALTPQTAAPGETIWKPQPIDVCFSVCWHFQLSPLVCLH